MRNDIIDVEIQLTNISWSKLRNVAYAEKIPEVFVLDETSVYSEKEFEMIAWDMWYHFLIKNFDLNTNESITITYKAKTQAIKYWYLKSKTVL